MVPVSVTFQAMLIPGLGDEHEAVRALNVALHIADAERHQNFEPVDMEAAGGTKSFTNAVYAACFNHLVPTDVEECVVGAPWRYPEYVLYLRDLGDYSMDGDPIGWTCETIAALKERIA